MVPPGGGRERAKEHSQEQAKQKTLTLSSIRVKGSCWNVPFGCPVSQVGQHRNTTGSRSVRQAPFVCSVCAGNAAAAAIVAAFALAAVRARKVANVAAPVANKFMSAATKLPYGAGTTAETIGAAADSCAEMGGVTLTGTGAGVEVTTPVVVFVLRVGGPGGGPRNSDFKAEQEHSVRVTLVARQTSTMNGRSFFIRSDSTTASGCKSTERTQRGHFGATCPQRRPFPAERTPDAHAAPPPRLLCSENLARLKPCAQGGCHLNFAQANFLAADWRGAGRGNGPPAEHGAGVKGGLPRAQAEAMRAGKSLRHESSVNPFRRRRHTAQKPMTLTEGKQNKGAAQ